MYILFIIVFCVLLVFLYYHNKTTLIEPFTKKFFEKIKPTYFIGIDQSQLFGDEFDLIQSIAPISPFNINFNT